MKGYCALQQPQRLYLASHIAPITFLLEWSFKDLIDVKTTIIWRIRTCSREIRRNHLRSDSFLEIFKGLEWDLSPKDSWNVGRAHGSHGFIEHVEKLGRKLALIKMDGVTIIPIHYKKARLICVSPGLRWTTRRECHSSTTEHTICLVGDELLRRRC